jgi:hypothetical protein
LDERLEVLEDNYSRTSDWVYEPKLHQRELIAECMIVLLLFAEALVRCSILWCATKTNASRRKRRKAWPWGSVRPVKKGEAFEDRLRMRAPLSCGLAGFGGARHFDWPLHLRNEMISTAAPADQIRKIGNLCNWDNLNFDEMSGAEKHAREAPRVVPRSVGLGQLRGAAIGERMG